MTDRRVTLQWMLAAAAAAIVPVSGRRAFGATGGAAVGAAGVALGYGTDPDLLKRYRAGDIWPLLLTPVQRRAAGSLADVIIPTDARSPSASAVGIVDFLDEWVSAPYEHHRDDLDLVVYGLGWIDAQGSRRFGKPFAELAESQQHALCDDICREESASPALAQPAKFFARFRDLTAGGFYSTPAGRTDLGYIGNVPQTRFDGPPIDVLRKLGLAP